MRDWLQAGPLRDIKAPSPLDENRMSSSHQPPRFAILLCTYNGAKWLPEQLASFVAQSHEAWDLWVSDDGSTDETLAILQAFQTAQAGRHQVHILQGPRAGGAGANFLSLLAYPDLPEGPIAVSDQDDIWLPHKLARAWSQIKDQKGIVLYGAASLHIDAEGRRIGRSVASARPPSLQNALWQNVVSGHSTVLNAEGARTLRRLGVPKGVTWHDWWLYQLISAMGGKVIVDSEPVLHYRQHGGNVMGGYAGFRARLLRLGQIFSGTFGGWFEGNLTALGALEAELTPQAAKIISEIAKAPKGAARSRIMRQHGLHRQSGLETRLLQIAARLGKI